MATRSPSSDDQHNTLPDLPFDIWSDDLYGFAVESQPAIEPASEPAPIPAVRRRSPEPQQERPRQQPSRSPHRRPREEPQEDVIMSVAPSASGHIGVGGTVSRRRVTQRSSSPPFVFPPFRALLDQAMPSLVMVATALLVAAIGPMAVFGIPVWAFAATIPSVLFLALTNSVSHPIWYRASVVNLLVLLAIFPILVVRQSVSRVPYIDTSSGTLVAPVIATLVLIALLVGLGAATAILCREDPEFAGVIFLPAAMFVPFFAGRTSITSLRTAMLMMAGIFLVTAVLTIIASVVSSTLSSIIAPAAIMVQFLILAASRGESVFPLGAGNAARMLFFVTVAITVALTVLVPMASYWVRQVSLLVQASDRTRLSTSS